MAAFRTFMIGVFALGLVVAAGAAPAALEEGTAVKNGVWGAQGVMLDVKADGATIEYDCGHGTIPHKLMLGADGTFALDGRHFREGPGPTKLDDEGEAARYEGAVKGDTLTLTVTLSEKKEKLGSYTLTFGRRVILKKCY